MRPCDSGNAALCAGPDHRADEVFILPLYESAALVRAVGPECEVLLCLAGTTLPALVDSGAQLSLLSRDALPPAVTTRPSAKRLHDAQGNALSVAGEAEVPFRLGTLKGTHTFIVVDRVAHPVILGTDFQRVYDCYPRAAMGWLQTPQARIPFLPREQPTQGGCLRIEVPKDELNIGSHLSPAQRTLVASLITPDLFASEERPLGRAKNFVFDLRLTDPRPIRVGLRRVAPKDRDVVATEIAMLRKLGAISPSRSPWACAVVLVPKKDGTTRFCIDYRPLNDRTVRDSHPLPLIQEMLSMLQGSHFFTTLDAASGYWQVPLHPSCRPYTAFICSEGLFEWNVLPFGLKNAPPFYQRMMNEIFAGLIGRGVLVYVDDILIYGPTLEAHNRVLAEVLSRLRDEGILLKGKKCLFAQPSVEFLGHVVSQDGVSPSMSKVKAICCHPTPSNVTEIRTFLGMGSYYRRFIRGFALLAAPLHELTHQDKPWDWTPECDAAFRAIRDSIAGAAIQAHPDFGKPFIVDTDASDVGIAVVLSQVDDEGSERPIQFDSRKLTRAESKWPIREKEALAIVWGLEKSRPYILGGRFHVRTDHSSLEWLFKAKSGRLCRWAIRLAEFTPFEIVHRAGKKHCNVDALTRIFAESECLPDHAYINSVTAQPPVLPDRALWIEEQGKDAACIRVARDGKGMVRDGLLGIGRRSQWRPILPRTLVESTAKAWHNGPGAHLGARKLLSVMSRHVVIPAGGVLVKTAVQGCLLCSQRKPPKQKLGLMASSPPSKPWHTVAMDFAGPYAPSASGNRYVLVFVDQFTKWVELVATPDQLAATVVRAFYQRVICRHGAPARLLSDNGPQFRSSFVDALCAHFDIRKVFTSAYYPQGDGYAERMMRTMNNSLSALSAKDPERWDEFLPGLQFAYNAAEHEATKLSPFELCTGRVPMIPGTARLHDQTGLAADQVEYLSRLRNTLTNAYDRARNAVQAYWGRMKQQFDRNRKDVSLVAGDLVLICLTEKERAKFTVRKLAPRWSSPAEIVNVITNRVTYTVKTAAGETRVVHISQLLPLRASSWGPTFPEPDQAEQAPSEPAIAQLPEPMPERPPRPAPEKATPTQERFTVKNIVDSRNRGTELLVHWEGYDSPQDYTWEPRSNMEEDVPHLVKRFDRRVKGKTL